MSLPIKNNPSLYTAHSWKGGGIPICIMSEMIRNPLMFIAIFISIAKDKHGKQIVGLNNRVHIEKHRFAHKNAIVKEKHSWKFPTTKINNF